MNFLLHHTVVKFFIEGLWRDEAFSWAMASQGLGILPLTARDFNPPLYYLLLYGWMHLTGSSEAAMRSLSIIFFAATLWVVWRFMRELLEVPRRRAAVYLVLLALNPMLSYYAVEARMYSLLALLAAASFYAYLTRRSLLYVLATTAGLYTHYFMLLVIGCQVLGTLATAAGRPELRRRVMLAAVPLLLLTPWLAATVWLKEDYGGAFWVEQPGWKFGLHLVTSMFTGYDAVYGFLEGPERWLYVLGLLPLVAWSVWAGMEGKRGDVIVHAALWALLPATLIFVAGVVKPLYVPRYLIFSTVGLLLLLIGGLERLRPGLRAAGVVALLALSIHYQVLQSHRHSKGALRETIAGLASRAAPEDLLLVQRELDFFPAQYYFGPARVFVIGRRYDEIAAFTGKVLIPPSRVLSDVPPTAGRVYVLYGDTDVTVLQGSRPAARAVSASREDRLAVAGGRR